MIFTYGTGADLIELQFEKTHIMAAEAILDQRKNYMYTRHEFDCEFLVNPRATNYRRTGTTFDEVAVLPTRTHEVIRQKLLEQRKVLIITDSQNPANTILRSPKNGETLDATGGPTPLSCDILSIEGDKSFRARWKIVTELSEQDKWCVNGEPILLSFTWRSTAGINERLQDAFIFEGRAIFNESYLQSQSLSADDFRRWLIPKPVNGMRRSDLSVTLEEDGRTVVIRFTDIDTRHHYKGFKGITDIEAKAGYSTDREDPILGLALTGISAVDMYRNHRQRVNRQRDQQPSSATAGSTRYGASSLMGGLGGAGGGLLGVAVSVGQFTLNAIQRWFPTRSWWVMVRVWGSPEAEQRTLQKAARLVVEYQFRAHFGFDTELTWNAYNLEEVHDPVENFIEIRWQMGANILQRAQGFLESIQNPQQINFPAAGFDTVQQYLQIKADDHIHIRDYPFRKGEALAGSHLPQHQSGTRQNLVSLVTQVIRGTCAAPGEPQQMRATKSSNDPSETFF